jgi:hypothetical protein
MIREAEEKTGKYVHSLLKQLEQQLGVHAVMFVAYKDTNDEIKVSEYVFSKHTTTMANIFKALNPREYLQATDLGPSVMMRSIS